MQKNFIGHWIYDIFTKIVLIDDYSDNECLLLLLYFSLIFCSVWIFHLNDFAPFFVVIFIQHGAVICQLFKVIISFQINLLLFLPDINECEENTATCDQICENRLGSYQCTCQQGYSLFTANGTNGFYIAPGETGDRPGDLFQINHSCVCECQHLIHLFVYKTMKAETLIDEKETNTKHKERKFGSPVFRTNTATRHISEKKMCKLLNYLVASYIYPPIYNQTIY